MVSQPGSSIGKTMSNMGNRGIEKSSRKPAINHPRKDRNKINNKFDIGTKYL